MALNSSNDYSVDGRCFLSYQKQLEFRDLGGTTGPRISSYWCARKLHSFIQSNASIIDRIQASLTSDHKLKSPLVIGLTGGIASGKSAVASMFSDLGAQLLDADKIGHAVLDEEPVKLAIKKQWGAEVIRENRVSRRALAAIVFEPQTGAAQLEILESITHPRIRQRMIHQLAEFERQKTIAVVLDAPLLFEAGWDEFCDKILFVACSQEIRVRRAKTRGWTAEEFNSREASQLSVIEKQRRSTDVIDNSNDLETTRQKIQQLWQRWGLSAAPQ